MQIRVLIYSFLVSILLLFVACTQQQQLPSSTPSPVALQPTPTASAASLSPISTITPAPSQTPAVAGPPIGRGIPTATPLPNGVIVTATPIPGAAQYTGNARFAYTDNGNIYLYDSTIGKPQQLTNVAVGDWATDPAWSPDRKWIAYSLQVAPKNGQMSYADLMVMDADGKNVRILVAHDGPGAVLERPVWSPDAKTIYFAYTRPIFENGRYKDVLQEIASVPATGGERTSLITGALYPSLDRSGTRITYYDNVLNDVWVAELSDPNGTARLLIKQEDYSLVYAPRISPDGKHVVFISAGEFVDQGDTALPVTKGNGFMLRHGLPVDLWIADIESGQAKAITKYSLDSPYPAWSADSSQLAFISANGLYILNIDGSNLAMVSSSALHGEIDWASQ